MFAGQVPELSLPELLTRFGEEARLDGTYFFCKQESVLDIAKLLERVGSRLLQLNSSAVWLEQLHCTLAAAVVACSCRMHTVIRTRRLCRGHQRDWHPSVVTSAAHHQKIPS